MLVTLALTSGRPEMKGAWVIDANSQLAIEGSTNVNAFVCRIEYCTGTDTLKYTENDAPGKLHFTRRRMTVPIRDFNCGSRAMSKDFWRTLNADRYPNLEINFVSLDNIFLKNKREIEGVVDISLAGVTTRYNICYRISREDNGNVVLKGRQRVRFSEFQLLPPQKLKGLIKVNESLNVDFHLVLKEV